MQIQPVSPVLGAVLSGIDLSNATNAELAQVQQALLDHQVIFLRGQDLAPAAQLALARRFGEALLHPAYPTLEGAVTVLEATPDNPSKIDTWHSDMTFERKPPLGSVLHARILPPSGGDTMWASMYRAYDTLSAPIQRLVDELTAVHDFKHGFRQSLAEPGGWERLKDMVAARLPVQHPAVRTHPVTGRKALFVNALFTTGLVELSPAESDAVLAMLCEHAVQPEHTIRWTWQVGDVAIWDNRCTQHRPINDYRGHRRLHRVTIAGDVPR